MPVFNIYENMIVPLGESLQRDPRFGGIHIFYDRTNDRVPPRDQMPAINYFLEPGWRDTTRGTGAVSLQNRKMIAYFGFACWAYDTLPARLDKNLFDMSGNLLDFFRESRELSREHGICSMDEIQWDVNYSKEDNYMVGSQRLIVGFDSYGPPGKG